MISIAARALQDPRRALAGAAHVGKLSKLPQPNSSPSLCLEDAAVEGCTHCRLVPTWAVEQASGTLPARRHHA